MKTAMIETSAEEEIRTLIERWIEGARTKNLDAIMATYAPGIVSFDAIAQLQFKGAEAYRKHWETCLSYMPGPMLFEAHDLNVAAQGDVAFAHYLCRCGGTKEDGTEQTGWMRATVCCRKTGGRWQIVHEHYSAPFDPESSQALLNLEP
jgi:ketosteroid isomerase-like protein